MAGPHNLMAVQVVVRQDRGVGRRRLVLELPAVRVLQQLRGDQVALPQVPPVLQRQQRQVHRQQLLALVLVRAEGGVHGHVLLHGVHGALHLVPPLHHPHAPLDPAPQAPDHGHQHPQDGGDHHRGQQHHEVQDGDRGVAHHLRAQDRAAGAGVVAVAQAEADVAEGTERGACRTEQRRGGHPKALASASAKGAQQEPLGRAARVSYEVMQGHREPPFLPPSGPHMSQVTGHAHGTTSKRQPRGHS